MATLISDVFRDSTESIITIPLKSSLVTSGQSRRLWGTVGVSAADFQTRYGTGIYAKGNSTGTTGMTAGALCLQNTGLAKLVSAKSYLNGVIVEQEQIWLRMWREISYFEYKYNNITAIPGEFPVAGIGAAGAGSIGYGPFNLWSGNGAYQIWWLIWKFPDGSHGGAMCDMGFAAGSQYEGGKIPAHAKFGSMFRTNGLSVIHSPGSEDWSGGVGLNVYTDPDEGTKFYLSDVSSQPQSATAYLLNKPASVQVSRKVYSYPDIKWDPQRDSFPYKYGEIAPNVNASNNEVAGYKWGPISLYGDGNSGGTRLALDADDIITLEQALLSTTPPTLPTLSATLGSTNWVSPNLELTTSPDATKNQKYWYPHGETWTNNKRLKLKVVNGTNLATYAAFNPGNPNSGSYAIDNGWVSGNVGPTFYWYILPEMYRTKDGGCCKNKQTGESAEQGFANQFNDCTRGRH